VAKDSVGELLAVEVVDETATSCASTVVVLLENELG
jgi:hypothetical protein